MQLTAREKEDLHTRWRDDRVPLYDRILQPGHMAAADLWLLIPKGKKCLLWFTYMRGGPACVVVDVDWKGNPVDFHIVLMSFHRDLAFETIIGGVMIENLDHRSLFCCTYVNVYKGKWISRALDAQISATNEIMTQLIRHNNSLPTLHICLPRAVFHEHEVESSINKSPVAIYGIRMANIQKNQIIGVMKQTSEQVVRCIMLVKPETEEDVYSLWSGKQIGHALVPDYKTSVMLNSIFRNVKENTNLDLLEESDDEEDFENVAPDRYVLVKEGLTMQMQYMPRFDGWRPCEVVSHPPTNIDEVTRLQSIFRDTRQNKGGRVNNDRSGGRGRGPSRGTGRGRGHRPSHGPSHGPSRWLGGT